MPIIKSAIKRMKQTKVRQARRLPFKSHMKTMIKKVLLLAKQGNKAEAEKALPLAFKAVDTAVKKHMLHRKTGDRRKSLMSRAIAAITS